MLITEAGARIYNSYSCIVMFFTTQIGPDWGHEGIISSGKWLGETTGGENDISEIAFNGKLECVSRGSQNDIF